MAEDTRKVLEMLSAGKVTVQEAEQLLQAVTAAPPPADEKKAEPRYFRILVNKPAHDGKKAENVNIRVPITVVRGGLRLGAQFQARAKSVIFLFMYGGPSHVDLLDPKPELIRNHGKPMTGKGEIDVFFGNPGNLMASPYKFKKHGGCGTEVSELYPHLAGCVDDLCLIRSLHSTSNNHSPAIFHMNSGNMRPGNPSLGSWVTYGLGSFNENLPSYIVMYDWRGGPIGGAPNWSSGFMPAA